MSNLEVSPWLAPHKEYADAEIAAAVIDAGSYMPHVKCSQSINNIVAETGDLSFMLPNLGSGVSKLGIQNPWKLLIGYDYEEEAEEEPRITFESDENVTKVGILARKEHFAEPDGVHRVNTAIWAGAVTLSSPALQEINENVKSTLIGNIKGNIKKSLLSLGLGSTALVGGIDILPPDSAVLGGVTGSVSGLLIGLSYMYVDKSIKDWRNRKSNFVFSNSHHEKKLYHKGLLNYADRMAMEYPVFN